MYHDDHYVSYREKFLFLYFHGFFDFFFLPDILKKDMTLFCPLGTGFCAILAFFLGGFAALPLPLPPELPYIKASSCSF